jgi:hypothetical protein
MPARPETGHQDIAPFRIVRVNSVHRPAIYNDDEIVITPFVLQHGADAGAIELNGGGGGRPGKLCGAVRHRYSSHIMDTGIIKGYGCYLCPAAAGHEEQKKQGMISVLHAQI